MDRTMLNYILDGVLGVLLLATTFSWRDYYAHLVLGMALVSVVAAHLLLHKQWVTRQVCRVLDPERPLRGRIRTNFIVDTFIGATFVLSTTSGLAILLSAATLWTGLHSLSSWSMFLGCLLHLALHAKWISMGTGRVLTRHPDRTARESLSS